LSEGIRLTTAEMEGLERLLAHGVAEAV
jgi:hypothetical protein